MSQEQLGIVDVLRTEVVKDSIKVCATTDSLKIVEDDISLTGAVQNGDLATAAGEGLILHGHGLAQAMELDTETADDLAWSEVIRPIYLAVAGIYSAMRNPTDVLETNPARRRSQRVEWNIVMNKQRYLDGQRVMSPFGVQYAEDLAAGRIVIPGSMPLNEEYEHRISAIMDSHRIGAFEAITSRLKT